MARKFFYVCAGICLLALSYHLGASAAVAQSAQFRVLDPNLAIETGGQVYFLGEAGWVLPSSLPPVPASSLLAGRGPYITTDGTAWRLDGYQNEWRSYPLPGAPTSTLQESWGQLKARYRGDRGTAQPGAAGH